MPRPLAALALVLLAFACLLPRATRAQHRELGVDDPYLLTMPDLSSPRSTLEAIMTNGDIVEQEFMTRGPSWIPRPSMLRMVETIDSSEMSAAHRLLATALTAVRLKVTLTRLPPDRLAAAPDAEAVRRNNIKQWTVPGTPITLALAESGPNAGQFRFTPATAALAGQLYQASTTLADKDGTFTRALDNWASTPGPLLPAAVVATFPKPLHTLWAGQALWQWIGLVVLLIASLVASFSVVRWGIRRDRRETRAGRRFAQPVAALVLMGVCISTMVLAFFALKIWGDSLGLLILILKAIVYLAFAWFGIATVQRIGAIAAQTSGLSATSIDGQMVRVVCTLLGIGVGLIAGFAIADLFGVPVGPLLAGLGIGGLAIALAIRPTLENVIGGLTLFADRPIRVGEFCRFGSESGTVEEIGLRTTKVRRLDDTLVTIPNSELAQIRIENITRRRRFLFNPRLGLRYETTAEQLLTIEQQIVAMLEAHPKVQDDGVRTRFSSFGDYTLNLDVFAYVDVNRMPEFVAVQEDLNLRIMEIVRKAGAAFAFPSQTNYVARDSIPEPS